MSRTLLFTAAKARPRQHSSLHNMQFVQLLILAVTAYAAPTPHAEGLSERAVQQCGQYQTQYQGPYNLATNGWGWSTGTGSQCSQINSVSGNTIAWETSWSWSGGPTSVKSYTNVQQNSYSRKPLSQYTSIPTTWKWSQTGTSLSSNGMLFLPSYFRSLQADQ